MLAAISLVTGSIWGAPTWGTWWVWDARLTSMLILFLTYLGYLALWAAVEDEEKAARLAAVLCLAGVINVPIVHFSVEWWSTLHQRASVMRAAGRRSSVHAAAAHDDGGRLRGAAAALTLAGMRAQIFRRRALAAQGRGARGMISLHLSDPHWATFIWPAYAVTIAGLCGLAAFAFLRLQHWARPPART